MFDDEPIEVGKERNRFLTEESGRRVYFPLVGPARIVPSRDQEAKLREARFFVWIAGMVLLTGAVWMRVYWPEWSIPFAEGWIMALTLAACELIASYFARRWTAIPPADL